MKQSNDSSDDFKFPVTANQTLSEKTAFFNVVTVNASDRVHIPVNSDEMIFFFYFIILYSDSNVIIFSVYNC